MVQGKRETVLTKFKLESSWALLIRLPSGAHSPGTNPSSALWELYDSTRHTPPRRLGSLLCRQSQ